MARTNKYHSETEKGCKPSFFARRRKWFGLCDLVRNCILFSYFIIVICSTTSIDAKVSVTGSGGYSSRRIHLDLTDGGYKGIVVKINKDVPEKHCPKILSNIKVRRVKCSISS